MKVLLFDFDGVIADTLDYFIDCFLAACAELGHYHIDSRQTFLDLFDTNFYEALEASGVPRSDFPPIMKSMKERVMATGRSYTHYPQIPETIRTLAQTHTLYIITSNHSEPVSEFLHQHGLDCFTDILGSDHHPSKTAKIEQIKAVHPEAQMFYIGDTKGDMLEAQAAEIATVAAAWGWHPAQKLQEAAPDHLAHEPAELLQIFPGS